MIDSVGVLPVWSNQSTLRIMGSFDGKDVPDVRTTYQKDTQGLKETEEKREKMCIDILHRLEQMGNHSGVCICKLGCFFNGPGDPIERSW